MASRYLNRKDVWDRKPDYPVALDWGNPLLRGLELLLLHDSAGTTELDISGNGNDGTLSGATRVFNQNGKATRFDGVNDYINIGSLSRLVEGTPFTLFGQIIPASASSGTHTVISSGTGVSANRVGAQVRADVFTWGLYDGSSYVVKQSGPAEDGVSISYCVCYDGLNGHLILNGVLQTGTTQPLLGGNDNFVIGSSSNLGDTGKYYDGDINVTGVLSQALSVSEAIKLTKNIYQIFPRRSYWVMPGTATGVSVDVPAGSVTYTGQAPTVTTSDNQEVTVPTGSVSYTGYAPTISVGGNQSVEVPVGSIAYTGQVPTVTVSDHQAIDVPVGSVTYTGYAPTVTVAAASPSVEVPVGSVVYTGYAPTVTTESALSRRGGWALPHHEKKPVEKKPEAVELEEVTPVETKKPSRKILKLKPKQNFDQEKNTAARLEAEILAKKLDTAQGQLELEKEIQALEALVLADQEAEALEMQYQEEELMVTLLIMAAVE